MQNKIIMKTLIILAIILLGSVAACNKEDGNSCWTCVKYQSDDLNNWASTGDTTIRCNDIYYLNNVIKNQGDTLYFKYKCKYND